MFRKRIKKTFPPGTFIPTPVRVLAILQLCIAFSVFLWNASQPFMGDLFATKSKLLVYHHVMGVTDDANRVRFRALPQGERELILDGHEILQSKLGESFFKKLKRSFEAIFVYMPRLELTWLILSVVLTIFLLKKVEGAVQALWVLPALALLYGGDQILFSVPREPTAEERLFPTEEFLMKTYGSQENHESAFKKLQNAWEKYLVAEWTPKGNGTLEKGLFAFHVERVKILAKETSFATKQPRDPFLALLLYIIWNSMYAGVAYCKIGQDSRKIAQESS